MLTQLRLIDSELREAVAELAALTGQPTPDQEPLSRARLKLGRLSGRRRVLIQNTVLPRLGDVSEAKAAELCDLRLRASELAVRQSEHIGRWPISAVMSDWAGYQRASAEMRKAVLVRAECESAVLYPLLQARAA